MREEELELDPRVERLARGELSAEERRALDEEAKSNPELANAIALCQPLSDELRAKLARTVSPPARVIPFRRIAAIASIAAAAAVGLLWLPIGTEPLPRYALEARVNDAEFRGGSSTASHVRSDSIIEIRLVPAEPAGEVAAKLFVLEQGELRPIAIRAQSSEDGAVRWSGRADALAGGRTGTVTLVAKVGRPGAPLDTWQSMSLEVHIRDADAEP